MTPLCATHESRQPHGASSVAVMPSRVAQKGASQMSMCPITGYDDMDPRDEYEPEPEKRTPVAAACCPVCGDQSEENEDGFCPPIALTLCGCDHYACTRCVKHCADSGCANTICGDCASLCEGCAEVHCEEHVVAKNYCKECVPDRVRHEHERPDYVYED